MVPKGTRSSAHTSNDCDIRVGNFSGFRKFGSDVSLKDKLGNVPVSAKHVSLAVPQ